MGVLGERGARADLRWRIEFAAMGSHNGGGGWPADAPAQDLLRGMAPGRFVVGRGPRVSQTSFQPESGGLWRIERHLVHQ